VDHHREATNKNALRERAWFPATRKDDARSHYQPRQPITQALLSGRRQSASPWGWRRPQAPPLRLGFGSTAACADPLPGRSWVAEYSRQV